MYFNDPPVYIGGSVANPTKKQTIGLAARLEVWRCAHDPIS